MRLDLTNGKVYTVTVVVVILLVSAATIVLSELTTRFSGEVEGVVAEQFGAREQLLLTRQDACYTLVDRDPMYGDSDPVNSCIDSMGAALPESSPATVELMVEGLNGNEHLRQWSVLEPGVAICYIIDEYLPLYTAGYDIHSMECFARP